MITSSLSTQARALAQISLRADCRSSSDFHPPPGVLGITAGKPFEVSNAFSFCSRTDGECTM